MIPGHLLFDEIENGDGDVYKRIEAETFTFVFNSYTFSFIFPIIFFSYFSSLCFPPVYIPPCAFLSFRLLSSFSLSNFDGYHEGYKWTASQGIQLTSLQVYIAIRALRLFLPHFPYTYNTSTWYGPSTTRASVCIYIYM